MKLQDRQNIIADLIYHAVAGFGLGKIDKMSDSYDALLEEFKKNFIETIQIKKLYIDSVESFLITEIQTVTGYDDSQVLSIYDEFRKDLGLPNAFPDR